MQSNHNHEQAPTTSATNPVPMFAIQGAAVAAQAVLENKTTKIKDQVKLGLDSLFANVVPSTDKINGFFSKAVDFGAAANKNFTNVSNHVKAWVDWFVAQVTEIASQVPERINQLCKFISDTLVDLIQSVTNLFTGPAPVEAPAPQ